MKQTCLLLFNLIVFNISCVAQRVDNSLLTGIWQVKSHEIGSAYLDNYQFFKTGEFKFNVNQYNELKRIISIKGSYSIKDDTIYFKATSLVELTGGDRLIRSKTSSLNDSWSLVGNLSKKETILKKSEIMPALIKLCESVDGYQCILIEGNRFYKILKDPNDY